MATYSPPIPISPRTGQSSYQHDTSPDFRHSYKYSQSYPPSEYRYRYQRYPHFSHFHSRVRFYRKAAYIVAAVNPSEFITLGAKEIYGLYLLPRQYDGTEEGETCAIIGIPYNKLDELLFKQSTLYETIKNIPELQHVPGIKELAPYRLGPLRSLSRLLKTELMSNELVLFNIEPCGNSPRTKQAYPSANLCLPGGGMEPRDEFDYARTAYREFAEEVGAELNDDDIQLLVRYKYHFPDRQAMYFVIRCHRLRPRLYVSDSSCTSSSSSL